MSDKLYAFISENFDSNKFTGLLMAAESADAADGFTEEGYEGEAASLVEVTSKAANYADEDAVIAAMEAAGLRVYETYDDYEDETGRSNWDDDDVFVLEHKTLNKILESKLAQNALDAAGFDAARDWVVVTNHSEFFTMFWKRGTFEVSEPIPVPHSDLS